MTKLCPRGKAAAKKKFKVYPSAYANAYASRICAGKIKDPSGTKRKDFRGPKPMKQGDMVNVKKYGSGALTSTEPTYAQESETQPQGPQQQKEGFAIEPQIRGASSFDQNIERKTKGASLYLHTPGYGRVGAHYDKDTDIDFDGKLDTKRKSVSYDIQKDIGSGTLTAGASIGTSENALRSGKTKSGMLSYTIPIGKIKGGLANEKQFKYNKGGFEEGNYQDYVLDLIK